jgi:hypothetical protein
VLRTGNDIPEHKRGPRPTPFLPKVLLIIIQCCKRTSLLDFFIITSRSLCDHEILERDFLQLNTPAIYSPALYTPAVLLRVRRTGEHFVFSRGREPSLYHYALKTIPLQSRGGVNYTYVGQSCLAHASVICAPRKP